MDCGSGFPAAKRLNTGRADRGWPRQVGMQAKAAPTIEPTSKTLKLMPVLRGGTMTGYAVKKIPLTKF
jgi:hypothetical protein